MGHSICFIRIFGLRAPVLAGDTVHDERGAREAGIPFIYCSYGFGEQSGDAPGERGERHDPKLLDRVVWIKKMERVTGIEPATITLAT